MIQSEILNIRDMVLDKSQIKEHLNCGICQELALDARECEKCENLFCLKCIEDWMKINELCPYKCSQQKMNYKNPHRLIKNEISQIQLKCQYFNQGCQQTFPLEKLESHKKECDYRIVKCRFQGCVFEDIKLKMKDHEQRCEFRVEFCHNCELEYLASEQNHDCVKNLKEKYKALDQQTTKTIEMLNQRILELEKKLQLKLTKPSCNQGHELQWIQPRCQQCSECGYSNEEVRYCCKICKSYHCQKCKKPQFQGAYCPINHILLFSRIPKKSLVCDYCGKDIYYKGDSSYSDRDCDFDICSTCFNQLSQQIQG